MKYIYILFILFCVSCNNESFTYQELALPKEEKLDYTLVSKNIPAKYILELHLKDSIIILGGKDTSACFFMYNRFTGEHIKDFFKIGRGPFEGVAPKYVNMEGDSCAILESNLRKGNLVNLSKLSAGNDDFYKEIDFKMPEDRPVMMAGNTIKMGNNNYLISIPFVKNQRFAICSNPYSEGAKEIKDIYSIYPKVVKDTDDNNILLFQYFNYMAISPDFTKFANFTSIGAIAETFKIQQDTMMPIATKGFLEPTYSSMGTWITPNEDSQMGFNRIIASNQYIYALYNGCQYNDNNNIRKIVVFDWELNPVKLYTVSDLIIDMEHDPKTGEVYAIIKDKEMFEFNIVKFNKNFIQ